MHLTASYADLVNSLILSCVSVRNGTYLVIATSSLPHMKVIVVRLLIPPTDDNEDVAVVRGIGAKIGKIIASLTKGYVPGSKVRRERSG